MKELVEKILTNWLAIISILCFFAGTIALSAGLLSNFLAQEFFHNQKPRKFYRFFGYTFGIRNKHNANRQFMGGLWDEIKKNLDASAPIRGFIWYLIGTVVGILALLL